MKNKVDLQNSAFQFDGLERQGELRQDVAKIEQLKNSAYARFLPIFKQQLVIHHQQLAWTSFKQLQDFFGQAQNHHLIYLGTIEQTPYFAYRSPSHEALTNFAQQRCQSEITNNPTELRSLLPLLNASDAYLANLACGINHWHNSHQYCGYCGTETFASEAGFVRVCANQACQKQHFPRTDPAIIVAINHTDQTGIECLLLGRQASWPDKRYSVIAGFVEPGENLEQAVMREAQEEVGLELTDIQYLGSQPWPFPQSVMLGFKAIAKSAKIELKDQELETADWFSREQIHRLIKNDQLKLPFRYSISRFLVDNWLFSK